MALLPSQQLAKAAARYEAFRLRRELASIGAAELPVIDINHLLHHLRGEALSRLPQEVGHFVSVGCAGTWYFEWIEEKCRPRHHTGIEFYTPRPDDLPANATWIANTAGSMPELGDAVADVLFSGQNIEHLWLEDTANFLLEAHRVLKEGGLLVVDSPNRRITAKLHWVHPEHTIELEVEEIAELLELAGFTVTTRLGLWLCENPSNGAVLSFEKLTGTGAWPVSRRIAAARKNLDSAFIWWVEARKESRAPQVEKLRRRLQEIHGVAWPERLNRLKTLIGKTVQREGATWFDSEGREGPLLFGPYMPLLAGSYIAAFTLRMPKPAAPDAEVATLDVVTAGGARVLAQRTLRADELPNAVGHAATLAFSLEDTTFAIEFRIMARSGVRLLAKKLVELSETRE